MGYEAYHDEGCNPLGIEEERVEQMARLICLAMSDNPLFFDNLAVPMLVELDQQAFYNAAKAVIEAIDAEVAKLVDALDLGSSG